MACHAACPLPRAPAQILLFFPNGAFDGRVSVRTFFGTRHSAFVTDGAAIFKHVKISWCFNHSTTSAQAVGIAADDWTGDRRAPTSRDAARVP